MTRKTKMMDVQTGVLAAALAVGLACAPLAYSQPMGQPGGPMTGQPMGSPPMHPGMAPMGAMPTPDYVHAAAQSDEFEIAAAHIALHMSHNPHVRMFAKKMIHDHSKSTMMIKMAMTESGHTPPPPPPMKPEQDQMLSALRSAGSDFDHMYVDQQVQAHEMALGVQQAYASGGDNPALRHTAMKIVPVVQMHLDMARQMQSHMG